MSEPPDLETLARRYLDLWQDQVSALAADPEFTETVGRLLQVSASLGPAGWMSLWTAAAAGLKPQKAPQNVNDPSAAPSPSTSANTGSDAGATAGPAAAAAPHHDRGDDVAELRRRIAALEGRLAELGRAGTGHAGGRRRPAVAMAGEGPVAQDSAGPSGGAPARPRRRRS